MLSKKSKSSRRSFIKKASIGSAGAFLAPTILKSYAYGAAPSDRVRIAHIGVGDQGFGEIKNYFVNLDTMVSVATCDPHQNRRDNVASFINEKYKERAYNVPKVSSFLHYKEVLERDDVDAVHITTPDHWHVPMAIYAARAGKHIMLAKPLGLSIDNFKILEKELIHNDVRFHYATQQRAQGQMKAGIEMIKEGLIGDIEKVDVWCPGKNDVKSPDCMEVPVPEDFDYDLWTGPAPLNPYCSDRVTKNSSWFQYDYSIGFLGGWGAHPLDILVWGLKDKLSGKYSCEGSGKFWNEGGMYNNIFSWKLNYKYNSGLNVNYVSSDAVDQDKFQHYRKQKHVNGTTFWGTKGWISLSRKGGESSIPELDTKLKAQQSWANTFGQQFVDVVRGNLKETNPLDEAIISDTISHMGDMAIRAGQEITWDPVAGKVIDNEKAMQWFRREMRDPYTV